MGFKTGIDKKQLTLLPLCPDDYIAEDHICRVINAFTEQLNMVALGFKYAEAKGTGSRPYDPRMMLNLYIYGYLHRIRSSRRLQDETRRNLEVIWLMDGLTPDDKTICNFRTDNIKALTETFREFVRICRNLGLYGEELVATDSTKIRAQNSLKHHYNRTVIENELSRIDKRISEYLNALEQEDAGTAGKETPSAASIKAALEALKQRKVDFTELHERVLKEGEVSTVDPEARMMRSGGGGEKLEVGYNVQTVADSKNHMVVDFTVTNNSSDTGNLHKMSQQAKEVLEVNELTNLADKGYYDSEDIAACEEEGVTCLVAKRRSGGTIKPKEFSHENFIYNAQSDQYVCPCGNVLSYKRNTERNERLYRVYVNYPACVRCLRKSECTSTTHRQMWRLPCQDIVDVVDKRTRANKELYRQRQEIIEHVFGTVKAVWGYRQYLCRGKPKVTAETALMYLAYNMRRAVNIFKESRVLPVLT